MENFRRLEVWQRSIELAVVVRRVIRRLPIEEQHDLGDQMRRSSRSVYACIAEASGRTMLGRRNADSLRYLGMASGELHELDADLEFCKRIGHLSASDVDPMLDEIQRIRKMLAALIAYRARGDRERKA